jgi:hypothetical protein
MGKYIDTQNDIFSIFALDTWQTQAIKTYPQNYIAVNPGNEFIRVTIIPSGKGINMKSVSGILIIDIFAETGKGTKRTFEIADSLDSFLVGKSRSTSGNNVTQFTSSNVQSLGIDKDNQSLYRTQYSIPFNYYGVN